MIEKVSPSLVGGIVHAPASKSYAQRAVAIAALCSRESKIENIDICLDTAAAISVVRSLGAVVVAGERECRITGGNLSVKNFLLDIGESGLSTRLFTPIASLFDQQITITGHGSILSRPIDMMEAPLRMAGVEVSSNNGFLPITLKGPMRGGEITLDGSLSSQFLTGLLVALPLAGEDSVLNVTNLTSKPYIDMTIEVMESFGVKVTHDNYARFYVTKSSYKPTIYNVEGDWSGASCLLVAGAIAGEVEVLNLNPRSKQADKAILHALDYAGARLSLTEKSVKVSSERLMGFSFDATDCPDLFPALVALAAHCEGESILVGTNRLTHKESDRAKTLAETFAIMGIDIDLSCENVMKVKGGKIKGDVTVDSHNDHRIAMAAATAALTASGEVTISRSEAVAKSYPKFWSDLKMITK